MFLFFVCLYCILLNFRNKSSTEQGTSQWNRIQFILKKDIPQLSRNSSIHQCIKQKQNYILKYRFSHIISSLTINEVIVTVQPPHMVIQGLLAYYFLIHCYLFNQDEIRAPYPSDIAFQPQKNTHHPTNQFWFSCSGLWKILL